MSHSNYERTLVKYRLESSALWSDLYWCDSKQNKEEGTVQFFVAPATSNALPEDASFKPLSPELAKKLLVIDFYNNKPNFYCLTYTNNTVYRFEFDSRTQQFVSMGGRAWSLAENDYDTSKPTVPLKNAFTEKDIAKDSRLQMSKNTYDHQILHAIEAAELKQFNAQHTAYLQKQASLHTWQTKDRHAPVHFDNLNSSILLAESHYYQILEPITNALSAIKAQTNSPEEYVQALSYILSPTDQNIPLVLQTEVHIFRSTYLVNSMEYKNLFLQASEPPLLYNLYYDVQNLVAYELQQYDPTLNVTPSECPESYKQLYIGQNHGSQQQRETDDDLSQELIQQLLSEDLHNQNYSPAFFTPAPQSNTVAKYGHIIGGVLLTISGLLLAGCGGMGLIGGSVMLSIAAAIIGTIMSGIGIGMLLANTEQEASRAFNF